jgi:phospholipid transport system substrate-binding protein
MKSNTLLHALPTRLTLIPLLLLAIVATPAQAASTPTADLKGSIDAILVVLSDKGMSDADKRAKIAPIVDSRFDYRAMSQRVLSSNNWGQTSKAQQAEFSELFGQLLKNTYFTAISAYSDQTVAYTGERIKGKKNNLASVNTEIVSTSKRIPVEYTMRLKDDGWYVYDIKVEGISLVQSHQSTFLNIFKNEGMDGAIKALQEKVATKPAD